ncbi:MAG: L-2-amino-thiazoline-4-carboxylic acid hydrolase [Alphaproteobacteria bacterium]
MERTNEKLTPLMQRVKLQAEVLVPLLQHLRAELGEEKANSLIYPVLRDYAKKWIGGLASSESESPIENWRKTSELLETQFEGDVDYEIIRDDAEALDFNVSACRYADFFRQLNEPELGAILTCEVDNHIVGLAAPAVKLSRSDSIMKGGKNCPFRYRFVNQDG